MSHAVNDPLQSLKDVKVPGYGSSGVNQPSMGQETRPPSGKKLLVKLNIIESSRLQYCFYNLCVSNIYLIIS